MQCKKPRYQILKHRSKQKRIVEITHIPSVSSAKRLDRLWVTTKPAIRWVPLAFAAEVNRPGLDANYSSSSSARVKKKWSCFSTPHVYLNGVYSDKFSFLPQYDFILCSGDRAVP